jgi:[acyl-carrier-protein] S-malonyltransferase
MGRDLAAQFAEAKDTFQEADDVLALSLSRIAWDGPEDELTATHNAQPAILTHSIAVYRILAERLPMPISHAAGHSLGEFSAYVAAGSLSFADAVRTVRRRGELMFRSGQDRPGTMAAILGLDDAAVDQVCDQATSAGGECVAANYNAPSQVVISGDVPTVEHAMSLAKAAGAKRAIRLNVSGAFHSPLMVSAAAGLDSQLSTAAIANPRFPVISNVTGEPVTNAVDARRLIVQQLTSPVRWTRSMQTMAAAGVTQALELGPGNVLSGLLKRIVKDIETRALGTADELSAFQGALHA